MWVTQFEPLCVNEAGNLQHVIEMHVGVPMVEGIFFALDRVGQDYQHMPCYQPTSPIWPDLPSDLSEQQP